MNLTDSTEEARFRAAVRTWLDEHAPGAPRIAAEPSPQEVEHWRRWSAELYRAGYAGITWPGDAGGQGLPYSHLSIWLEERARTGVPDHFGLIGMDMAGPTIIAWGTPEQQARHLPSMLRAEEIWCQGFSEPGSGSDLASVQTTAVLDGDHWVVNGQKVWSSFAQWADWCILVARTDSGVAKHRGLSFLLMNMASPGVEVRPLRQITGDPEFNEIFLDDVRIPRDDILGAPGDGWKVALTTLDYERSTHGVALSAELLAELDAVRDLLRRPRADGTRAGDDPALRDRFTELWIEAQALRVTNLRSLSELDRTGRPGPEGTIAKLVWSEVNQRLAGLARDALGLDALLTGREAPDGGHWSYNVLRTRGNTIEAGTSEILRNIIAERVVGLPRSR